ncbi:MAG: phosphodiester glycosidase family protein [Candidatus Gracilibacteria bacterium]|nr:phosphodiester glycosidase family protein [Candidatus Gracilibacteria bacterium]
MNKLKIIIIFSFFFLLNKEVYANELYKTEIDGYKITAIKVVKGSGYKIIAGVSKEGESLSNLVSRYNGVSGVNGAYFCPRDYKECNGKNDSNSDRISNGTNFSKWDETGASRVIFAFDSDNNPFLFQNAHDYSSGRGDIYMTGRTINLDKKDKIYNGIGNFPLLLKNGENMLDKAPEISEKMKAKSLKNFICSTKDGNTIYMGNIQNPNIRQVPAILIKLGCYNAINLDAGGSSSMIYNSKYISGPGRNIMDAFIIVKDDVKHSNTLKQTEEERKKQAELKKKILENIAKKKQELSQTGTVITSIKIESGLTKVQENKINALVDSYYNKIYKIASGNTEKINQIIDTIIIKLKDKNTLLINYFKEELVKKKQ